MREITTIVSTDKYGSISFKLKEMLDKRGIARTRLAKATNVNYTVIKRLYDGNLVKLDLDVIAKVCYALECEVSDLIEYQPPK